MSTNGKSNLIIPPGGVPTVGQESYEMMMMRLGATTITIGGIQLQVFSDPTHGLQPDNLQGACQMIGIHNRHVHAHGREMEVMRRELAALRADLAEMSALIDAMEAEAAGIALGPSRKPDV